MATNQCEIARDLFAVCAEQRASKASMRFVQDHTRECAACRRQYQSMREAGAPSKWRHKWFKPRDTASRYLRWSTVAFNAMVTILCMVINGAADDRLTWAWIVAGAMACSTVTSLVYIQSVTYRFIRALAAFSVMVLPMVGVIQLVMNNIMGVGGVWFWSVALPVAAIWMAAVWGSLLVAKYRGWNGFGCIALLLFLVIPAEIATDAIASGYLRYVFTIRWLHVIVFAAASAATLTMGLMFDAKERQKKQDRDA